MSENRNRDTEPEYMRRRNLIPLAISIPRPLIAQMDAVSDADGYSRSGLIQQALREFFARRSLPATDSRA